MEGCKKILVPLDGRLPKNFRYVTALSLTIDDEYKLTGELIDQKGELIGEAQVIDLPLESMIINGSYDAETKTLILILQNGNQIEVPIEDLIAGLQEQLVSGENIKSLTINGEEISLLDSGTININSYVVIEQSGVPTSSTVAAYVGQFYIDTSVTPHNIYQCTAIDNSSTPTVYTWVRMIKITDVNGEAQNVSVVQNGTITDATTKALITSHLPTTLNNMLFSYSSEDTTNYQYYNISFNTTKEMNTITLATINKTTWVVKFYNNLSLNG